ncbi:hypothetical protein P154DRAFT_454755 [Amniculicola lignicola CBS 123094]|uniref:Uncharacterized protein n=1 Tax=Amniculicola lignicola CBS 123094 TaxID=1392246 RepID=A0A6A5WYM8_9PLEO|nr:hypothetical protein P154DRAFT_454755 [Amniculicola lignicola CBS 123094]
MEEITSPFLRLPFEIRLMIYEYLLFPSKRPASNYSFSVANLLHNHHTYASTDKNSNPFTLSVRTIDPYLSPHSRNTWRRRSTYYVRTGPFLTTTHPTTYRILLSPHTAHLHLTIPSLLPLSRQIHFEASTLLYQTYTFAFHTSIEALTPFLSDLTPLSRSSIRHLTLTKKALPYIKEFDRAEWSSMCTYLADAEGRNEMRLHSLRLAVVAGRPGDEGWDTIAPLSATDFDVLHKMQGSGMGVGVGAHIDLDWAGEMMAIRGLREMQVRALVEHCPAPMSEGMAFWVAFSASVEKGFAEWVTGRMVTAIG